MEVGGGPARSFYVVFDGSLSMAAAGCAGEFATRLHAAKWALKGFVEALDEADKLGLLVFDAAGFRQRVVLAEGTHERVSQEVEGAKAGGMAGTPLGAAAEIGVRALGSAVGAAGAGAGCHLVLVTDGEANDSAKLKRVLQDARRQGIEVHVLAFCVELPGLAKLATSYAGAKTPEELQLALAAVAAAKPARDATAAPLGARLRRWYKRNFPSSAPPSEGTTRIGGGYPASSGYEPSVAARKKRRVR